MFTMIAAAVKAATGGGGTDPFFANVSALLHFDGNGVDVTGKTWTASNSPTFDTVAPLYGTGSLQTGSGPAYYTSPSNAGFNFGTGNFTIEIAFSIPSGATPAGYYFFDGVGAGNLTVIQWNPSGDLAYYDPVTGSSGSLYNNGPSSSALAGTGRHTIAICRSGTTIYAFFDGVMWASQTGANHNKTHTQVRINDNGSTPGQGNPLTKIDEVRITKGVARYTSNYTPSSIPFPNS